MTEQELSDLCCVCHDTVATRRRELGLEEGRDYRIEDKVLVYTEEGQKRMLAAFGLGDPEKDVAATPGPAGATVGPEKRTLATAPVVWARVTRAKPNEAAAAGTSGAGAGYGEHPGAGPGRDAAARGERSVKGGGG